MKLIWFKIVLILVIVTYVCGDRKPGEFQDDMLLFAN